MRTQLPARFVRHPLARALFGGTAAIGLSVMLPAFATQGVLHANPAAAKRPLVLAASCKPCAAKRACNPCAARNPCAAKKGCNPCAAKKGCNPCAARNPCAAKSGCNPCGAGAVKASHFMRPSGTAPVPVSQLGGLVAEGERLWKDTGLSTNGVSCDTCHKDGANLNPSFAQPYPHKVAMPAQMAGVEQVHADEMVQFCMIVPMQAKPLAWNSRELAALTAYTVSLQKGFNPCAAKKAGGGCNPCAAKRACGPCAPKRGCNPCAVKNPCQPAGSCNPCAAKKRSS